MGRRRRDRLAAILLFALMGAAPAARASVGDAVVTLRGLSEGIGAPLTVHQALLQAIDDTFEVLPVAVGEGLVIGTFNAQFLPTFFSPKADPDDDVKRSARIAKRIIAGGYDIVVLNEIFDEEARETFLQQLSFAYPHYVAYLAGPGLDLEDSGLMLFSRFPFEALPVATHRANPLTFIASSNGAFWPEVAFIEYGDSAGPDGIVAKGVGFVRVRVPTTNRALNLAFTHMQASYDDDEFADWQEKLEIRSHQLGDVRNIIVGSLTTAQLQTEDILLLGDLNIDGDLADPNLGPDGGMANNLFEWNRHFGTGGDFFRNALRDAWAFETAAEDRGLTNERDQARFDYIARSRWTEGDPEGLCLQHATRALNLREGPPWSEGGLGVAGWRDLSDHIGVNALFNRWAPHCSPPTALAGAPSDQYQHGTITYPGSFQWYRFDEPGTYVFHVSSGYAVRHVYEGRDLSTPRLAYGDETITVTDPEGAHYLTKRFDLPDPPFYVRLRGATPGTTGDYDLFVKKFKCDAKATACILRPSAPREYVMPNMPLNADDAAWFELDIEAADSGLPQDLSFRLTPETFTGNVFTLILMDAATMTEIQRAEPVPDLPDPYVEIVRPHRHVGPQKFYLLAKRYAYSYPTVDVSFTIGWETNLTVLHGAVAGVPNAVPATLTCEEQTDLFGDDTIFMNVTVDGVRTIVNRALGDFDSGEFKSIDDALGTIRFLDRVDLLFEETDAVGDNDFLEMWTDPPAPGVRQLLNEQRWSADPGVFNDGVYTLRFNLSRTLY